MSTEDYYKVLCCYLSVPYYSTIENDEGMFFNKTNLLLSEIDNIRSQSEYASKYEYTGSDGTYKNEYIHDSARFLPLFSVSYDVVTDSNLILHNGVAEAIVNFCLSFFIPKVYKPLFTLATSNNVYDGVVYMLSDLAENAGFPEIGIILDLINLGASENDSISVTDTVVYISFNYGYEKMKVNLFFRVTGL